MPNKIWDKIFRLKEWGRYPSENLIKFIVKNFYHLKRSEIKILEIGCGPGANIWYLSREGFNSFGIDISSVAINKAQKRLEEDQLTASLKVGDVSKLPYESGTFHAVIDNACLYNNDKKKTRIILEEIKRVLKPQGLFYSQTFSDDIYKGRSFTRLNELEFKDASDGVFGCGEFFRLANKASIEELYDDLFTINSISKIQQIDDVLRLSYMIVVAQKK
tara:strand:- start:948 stop:1601 length:654 start_codon:yes stop_codon:yes gene_type:complete